jgi:hypothetical protein
VGDPGANFNIIQGNFIGTQADGVSPLGNQLHNIDFLDTASNNLVGGTSQGGDNRIAFVQSSQYDGVRIRDGCPGNFVSRNSIFSNANLGIVIGVIPGLNTSNLVTLTDAMSDGHTTGIHGSLNSYAGGPFLIQFYQNTVPNPSGYGEGFTYIGSTNITTGANGHASFVVTLPVGIPQGKYISATATDYANTTWEFSADVQVQSLPTLSISQSSAAAVPATISLTWPTTPSGFVLQQTANLKPLVVWSASTNTVTVQGTTNRVTTTTSGLAMFYRILSQSLIPPPLNLSISESSPGIVPATISLTWPTSPPGSILQQTANLNPPVIWTTSTNPVTVQGTTSTVTTRRSGTAMFYRIQIQ